MEKMNKISLSLISIRTRERLYSLSIAYHILSHSRILHLISSYLSIYIYPSISPSLLSLYPRSPSSHLYLSIYLSYISRRERERERCQKGCFSRPLHIHSHCSFDIQLSLDQSLLPRASWVPQGMTREDTN